MTPKVEKIAVRVIVVLIFSLPALIVITCLIDSFNYPRIARSAYWRHPDLLVRATGRRLFPEKGVCAEIIAKDAAQHFNTNLYDISLLYLADSPENDTTIRDRTFATLSKFRTSTREKLFWIVEPRNSPNDEPLVYEYRTGKLVCGEPPCPDHFDLE